MKTTGIFTLHYYEIPVETAGEPIYLIPVGDVHRYAPLHSESHWSNFLEWARAKERCYFLGMGDYMDLVSTTERDAIKTGRFHDSTVATLDELAYDNTDRFAREISFMGGKLVGMLEGNHYWEFQNGTTSTQKLCEMLGCKYLGVSSFIRLSFKYANTGNSASIDIWAHHGKGAARLIGGSLNKVQQMGEQAEADIFVQGHDHRKSAGTASKLRLTGAGGHLKLVNRKQLYLRSGSFLRGYVDDQPSYVADACLNPTDLGVVKIEMTPRKQGNEPFRIDLHASI